MSDGSAETIIANSLQETFEIMHQFQIATNFKSFWRENSNIRVYNPYYVAFKLKGILLLIFVGT